MAPKHCVALVLLLVAACTSAQSSAPAARPIANLQALGQFGNHHLGPIISKIITGAAIPDDTEKDGPVQVILTDMSVSKYSQNSFGLDIDPATKGARMNLSFDTVVLANVNICTEMFGKCRTILGCKGEVTLTMTGALVGEAVLGADAQGRPTAQIGSPSLSFSAFKMSGKLGICDVAEKYLNAKRAGSIFGKQVPHITSQINSAVAAKLAAVPTKLRINDLVGIDWSLTQAPAATALTMEVSSAAAVYKTKGGSYAPFTPTGMSPAAPTDDKPVGVALHQTVANSVLWAYFSEGLMSFDKSFTVAKMEFTVAVGATSTPTLSFVAGQGAQLQALVQAEVRADGRKIADAQVALEGTASVGFATNSEGHPSVFLKLASADVEDITLEYIILSAHTIPSEFIRGLINKAIVAAIPDVNAKLATVLVPLPALDGFTLQGTEIVFNSGYIQAVAGFTQV